MGLCPRGSGAVLGPGSPGREPLQGRVWGLPGALSSWGVTRWHCLLALSPPCHSFLLSKWQKIQLTGLLEDPVWYEIRRPSGRQTPHSHGRTSGDTAVTTRLNIAPAAASG